VRIGTGLGHDGGRRRRNRWDGRHARRIGRRV
jgi:hypothetical protein